ncbi:4a-hydroxytetrahydrobiopterin dehydratase [Bordetella genomosp. 5]|uniref:Putative pterin-4-alpha-carbinolamine dehydratase n=1 Tax=Bordetella genomosp. 5 TaxID=1395608 RepID=A0A261TBB7_9BORD|nr:4a-hydroxytetrahydrobiopterin dehydratase [Bordetella genomosp. 5]OZI46926.1 4a-hydroxytetrahydrobiopterin dehydratase [Bordetella genomosp. 5]
MSMLPPAPIGAAYALPALTGWQAHPTRDALQKRYRFESFNQAFGFMTHVALFAERLDHHPEWRNVYNRVDVLLTTHEAGGVTELDVRMAQFMDEAAARLGGVGLAVPD